MIKLEVSPTIATILYQSLESRRRVVARGSSAMSAVALALIDEGLEALRSQIPAATRQQYQIGAEQLPLDVGPESE